MRIIGYDIIADADILEDGSRVSRWATESMTPHESNDDNCHVHACPDCQRTWRCFATEHANEIDTPRSCGPCLWKREQPPEPEYVAHATSA
jgi:hypothetical protein